MLTIHSTSLEHTAALGRALAAALIHSPVRALLLRGDLGSGKTTLTRALVEALPGGTEAEICSPSFTICNQYPTQPHVLHCDLYRCPQSPPDDVLDALDDTDGMDVLTIIEWANFLPSSALPQEYLDITLQTCKNNHSLTLQAHGAAAEMLLRGLQQESQKS